LHTPDVKMLSLHTPAAGRSNNLEQQQNDHDQNDQAYTAATVVTDSRSQTIATESENQKQNNENDQHTFSFAARYSASTNKRVASRRIALENIACDTARFRTTKTVNEDSLFAGLDV